MKKVNESKRGIDEIYCSECGARISPYVVGKSNWSYKITGVGSGNLRGKFPQDSIYCSTSYQCSYTCNDHARLRVENRTLYTDENFKRYITVSESKIRAEGRSVRFPIDFKLK